MVARFLRTAHNAIPYCHLASLQVKSGLYKSNFAQEPPYGGAVLRNRATGVAALLR